MRVGATRDERCRQASPPRDGGAREGPRADRVDPRCRDPHPDRRRVRRALDAEDRGPRRDPTWPSPVLLPDQAGRRARVCSSATSNARRSPSAERLASTAPTPERRLEAALDGILRDQAGRRERALLLRALGARGPRPGGRRGHAGILPGLLANARRRAPRRPSSPSGRPRAERRAALLIATLEGLSLFRSRTDPRAAAAGRSNASSGAWSGDSRPISPDLRACCSAARELREERAVRGTASPSPSTGQGAHKKSVVPAASSSASAAPTVASSPAITTSAGPSAPSRSSIARYDGSVP
mgnify:CR=1 FL=1